MPLEESYKDWRRDALDAIERAALTGQPFDAYTLQKDHNLRQPPNPSSHVGHVFGMASRRGLIEVDALHRSSRPASKVSFRPLWRGLPTTERKTVGASAQ